MKKFYTGALIVSSIPSFAFASSQTLSDLAISFAGYLNQALVILMGVALVVFVWNIIKYFIKENDHKEAAPYVMWSIIGFFVILSVWGLVNILKSTFFGENGDTSAPSWSSFGDILPSGGAVNDGGGWGDDGGFNTAE